MTQVKVDKKQARIERLESLLVDYNHEFSQIVAKWKNKKEVFESSGSKDDAYVIGVILSNFENPNLKVCQKKLSNLIIRTKLPLFRDYYRKAREDVVRLRKVVAMHDKLKKLIEGKVETNPSDAFAWMKLAEKEVKED